jgi:type II secretory pathway component PulC
MDTAHFTSNSISPSVVMGQRIDSIKPESFWAKAGLEDNDVLVKVNNLPLNSLDEMKKAFGAAGKRFGFEVRRDQDTETIFYDCQ